jgi:branched-subunit amino acid transport protein AzlD
MEGSFEILERSSSRLVVRSRFRKTTFSPIPSIIIAVIIAGSLIYLAPWIFSVLFTRLGPRLMPYIIKLMPYIMIAMLVATEGSILLYGYGEWQITTTIDKDIAVMIVEWFRLSRNERMVMWTAQRKQYPLTSDVAFSVKF